MNSVFLLQHMYVDSHKGENVKIIGIYRSRWEAEEVVRHMSILPGFSVYPSLVDPLVDEEENGFYIDEYVLGKSQWTDGFSLN